MVPVVYYESVCFILLHFDFFLYFNKKPSLKAEIIVISLSYLVRFFFWLVGFFGSQQMYVRIWRKCPIKMIDWSNCM